MNRAVTVAVTTVVAGFGLTLAGCGASDKDTAQPERAHCAKAYKLTEKFMVKTATGTPSDSLAAVRDLRPKVTALAEDADGTLLQPKLEKFATHLKQLTKAAGNLQLGKAKKAYDKASDDSFAVSSTCDAAFPNYWEDKADATKQAASTSSPKETEVETDREENGAHNTFAVGKAGRTGGFKLKITDWKLADSVSDGYGDIIQADPGSTYVVFQVKVTNKASEPRTPWFDSATLSDTRMRSYSPNEDVSDYGYEIQPGLSDTATVAFNVPDNAKPDIVSLVDDDSSTAVPVNFLLRTNGAD